MKGLVVRLMEEYTVDNMMDDGGSEQIGVLGREVGFALELSQKSPNSRLTAVSWQTFQSIANQNLSAGYSQLF